MHQLAARAERVGVSVRLAVSANFAQTPRFCGLTDNPECCYTGHAKCGTAAEHGGASGPAAKFALNLA
jgi:hypothetical protein